jgi:hypothetical protein
LADALQAFGETLPSEVRRTFERGRNYASLSVEAPTPAHRRLVVDLSEGDCEYTLGKLWTEQILPTPETSQRILAMCDAVRDGRVREVRDRRTHLIYHLYRLKSRGLHTWQRDSEYAFRHYLRLPVRKVEIRRLPPLYLSENQA